MDRFSDSNTPLEIHENTLYHSINGGIGTCARALAGIFVVNGVDQVLVAGKTELESEPNIHEKNNVFFFINGLNLPSFADSNFATAIDIAEKSYAKCHLTAKDIVELQNMQAAWMQTKYIAVDVLGEFRRNCKPLFGLMSPLKRYLDWSELIDKMLITEECFEKECSDLYRDIAHGYINNQIPDELDVSALDKCVTHLREQAKFFHQFKLPSDLESNRIQLLEDLQSISNHLLEYLPETAKRALFRIYNERLQEEKSLYPSLFNLRNLDSEVIAILDGNIPIGQLGHSEHGA